MSPRPDSSAELIRFGWEIAESTLAAADSELTLVTHWFLTPEDDSANADDHFGSDERTLRFLAVALPTLIDQLGATMAVVAVPWNLDGHRPTLTVVGIGSGSAGPVRWETRELNRVDVAAGGPPFWRLEAGRVAAPEPLAAVAARLVL